MKRKLKRLFRRRNRRIFYTFVAFVLLIYGGYVFTDKVILNFFARPEISIIGDSAIVLEAGETYEEPGAAATVRGEDISSTIVIDTPDTTKLGVHTVTYKVTNKKGMNEKTATRTVEVKDTISPVVTLNGGNISLYVGNSYTEKGATALDSFEGDLTDKIVTEGSVDVNKVGSYKITYTVSDSSGNAHTATRTVTVKENPLPAIQIADNGNGKVVYLTFDDGPSARTPEILDILKKYNAKATFFVIGQNMSKYGYLLKRMVAEGHTVALHSNSHNYAQIYKSTDAFWADQAAIGEKVKAQIGYVPTIFRFPGGGSNTISRKYCTGVMSALVSQSAQKGLLYYDWNISSGDATPGGASAATITRNVINGINKGYKTPIVLLHDAGAKYTTVQALEPILKQATEAGYSFAAMTNKTPTVHQKVLN